MLKREHCALCENHLFSLEKGIYCFLTGERPAFEDRCESMMVYEDAKKAIVEIDSAILRLEKQQTLKNVSFIIYSVVGVALLIFIYHLTMYLFELGWVSILTIGFGLFGIAIIGGAAQNLNKYKNDYEEALEKKDNLDAVLRYYNIGYDTNVEIEKIHGELEFNYNIVFKSIDTQLELPVPIVAFQNLNNHATK